MKNKIAELKSDFIVSFSGKTFSSSEGAFKWIEEKLDTILNKAVAEERSKVIKQIKKMRQNPEKIREKIYEENKSWEHATESGKFAFGYNLAIDDITDKLNQSK